MMNAKKILIVDDDEAILDSLETLLDFEGHEVKSFERGSDIFPIVETDLKPDIILLDMWLSGEDGRDICRKLKSTEKTKDIPVLMMSASRGLEKTALDAGANDFISKPFELNAIVMKLNELTA